MAGTDSTFALDTYTIRKRSNSKRYMFRKSLPGGARIERSLGTNNPEVAKRRAEALNEMLMAEAINGTWAQTVDEGMRPKGWLRNVAANVRYRQKKRGGGISLQELQFIALRSEGRCEVSGIPFELSGLARHPFGPSVDRIDSSDGYTVSNTRLVCLAVNLCMSEWGEEVFYRVAAAALSRLLAKMAKHGTSMGRDSHPC